MVTVRRDPRGFSAIGAAHSEQNFALSEFSVPQEVHTTAMRRVYGPTSGIGTTTFGGH
jgi:hypothetical protein